MHKIGLGVFLRLEDWRLDSFFNALHIDYIQHNMAEASIPYFFHDFD